MTLPIRGQVLPELSETSVSRQYLRGLMSTAIASAAPDCSEPGDESTHQSPPASPCKAPADSDEEEIELHAVPEKTASGRTFYRVPTTMAARKKPPAPRYAAKDDSERAIIKEHLRAIYCLANPRKVREASLEMA